MSASKFMRIFIFIAVLAALLAACGPAAAPTQAPPEPAPVVDKPAEAPPEEVSTSVVLLFPGSINDGGWNTLGYEGLKQLEEEGYQVAYTENAEPANIATVTRGYADEGPNLIIGHGWTFVNDFMVIAPEYPEIDFFVTTNPPEDLSTVPENLQFYEPKFEYAGYMAGALAALVSESGKVGFVGGGDNPIQRMIGNAFVQGADETVPGTEAFVVITGDYNDAGKGREAATTMIGNGVDVVYQAADITGLGVIGGTVEGGALAIGMYGDQTSMAYGSFASSVYQDLAYAVINRSHATHDGTFRDDGPVWYPPLEHAFYFIAGSKDTPFVDANVSAEVQDKVMAIYNDLADGKIEVTINTD